MTDLIKLRDKDILYVYKEQWFTGFAPCFAGGMYSLACCKGNRKNGGMRASVCRRRETSTSDVWILSVAGQQITAPKHNRSDVQFEAGDLICLAKVKDCHTWDEYYRKYKGRFDAIYRQENGVMRCVDTRCHSELNMPTDCAMEHGDWMELKQIITSDEFFVFRAGVKCPEELSVNRGYRCSESSHGQLNGLLESKNIAYVSTSPFSRDREASECTEGGSK